jgi:CSLREA domain-containing protein
MKTDRLGKILLSRTARMILLLVMSIACTSIASAATYTVTKTADTNGTCNSGVDCSLREAIAAANSTPDNDTINFNIPTSDPGCSGGVCTITLNSSLGQLTINSASTSGTLTIRKSAATTQKIEISGNNAIRVFVVNSGANLTIENITVRNGLASTGSGGGIRNNGTTTIINSTVSNNSASPDGGGILNNSGAIVTIINSTVSNNSAPTVGGFGGGIRNDGTVTIINSTISNNSTSGNGGGILNFGTVNAQNTIIANNSASLAAPDFGGTLNSQGYNLIGNTSGTTIAGTTTGNILNQDPKLAPLGDYGGLTKTHALLLGSPALNAGSNSLALDQNGNALTMDQRGAARISGGTVDIGAYEQRVAVVTNTNDSGPGSLRNEATGSPFGGLITFNISGCPGNVCVITLSSQISITGAVIITNESSTQRIEISGNNATRVFQVNSGANLTINNVTVRNGNVAASGGGILNSGTLTMTNCTVSGNSATGFGSGGGGIRNQGTLTMTNCTVSGNGASDGGGISNVGTLTMTNCTVSGNSAPGGSRRRRY